MSVNKAPEAHLLTDLILTDVHRWSVKFILLVFFPAGIGHSLNHSTKSVIKPSLNWSGAVARVSLERAVAMGRSLTPMPWYHPSEALSLGLGWRVTPGVIPISHSPFLEVTLTTNPSLVDPCHQNLRKQVMASADYTAHNTPNVPPLAICLWTLPSMLTV